MTDDAARCEREVVMAQISTMRLSAPADNGDAFQIELLLDLPDGGVTILLLSTSDLYKLVELADRASKSGRGRSN